MTLENTLDLPAASLRGLCGGRVHLPGDPGYDAVRVPWNVAVDQRPAAVAVPHDADEVVALVRAAVAAGLRVAPQSTGHNAGPLAEQPLDHTVIVALSEMTGVHIDAEHRSARVIGGTLWRDVVEAAAAHGLAALHGSSPDVAVAGYTLGGGLSWYARQHGLATNHLTAVEIVTADGALVRADAEHHPDLFWAVRGGNGNFGLVTALEFGLLPLTDVYGGMLLWELAAAPQVLRAWAEWTRDLPESVTTSIRLMSFPPMPDLPPFLSGRRLVVIDGAILEDDETAGELLAGLRALAPEMDTFARMPVAGLIDIHMDPPGPTPAVSSHAMIESVPEEAIAALLAEVGPDAETSLLFAELRHLGGALSRPDPEGGALSHLASDYALFCIAIAPVPEAAEQGLVDAGRVAVALAPWSIDAHYLSFSEERVSTMTGFPLESRDRLRQIRAGIDPLGVFAANHEIPLP